MALLQSWKTKDNMDQTEFCEFCNASEPLSPMYVYGQTYNLCVKCSGDLDRTEQPRLVDDEWYTKSAAPTAPYVYEPKNYAYPPPAGPSAYYSCPAGHFFRIHWPENPRYGALVLSSSSGTDGKQLAKDGDFGLFFDTYGWTSVLEKTLVEIYTANDGRTIPDLSNDGEPWPPFPSAIIQWHDGSGPPPIIDKYALFAIEQIKAGKVVQVGCFGGHGRAGTFAAMVIAGIDGLSGRAATLWLRKTYCTQAVETKAQENGIAKFAKHYAAMSRKRAKDGAKDAAGA